MKTKVHVQIIDLEDGVSNEFAEFLNPNLNIHHAYNLFDDKNDPPQKKTLEESYVEMKAKEMREARYHQMALDSLKEGDILVD
jgi:hypothetical protein